LRNHVPPSIPGRQLGFPIVDTVSQIRRIHI
jgi:hypothetical protein